MKCFDVPLLRYQPDCASAGVCIPTLVLAGWYLRNLETMSKHFNFHDLWCSKFTFTQINEQNAWYSFFSFSISSQQQCLIPDPFLNRQIQSWLFITKIRFFKTYIQTFHFYFKKNLGTNFYSEKINRRWKYNFPEKTRQTSFT